MHNPGDGSRYSAASSRGPASVVERVQPLRREDARGYQKLRTSAALAALRHSQAEAPTRPWQPSRLDRRRQICRISRSSHPEASTVAWTCRDERYPSAMGNAKSSHVLEWDALRRPVALCTAAALFELDWRLSKATLQSAVLKDDVRRQPPPGCLTYTLALSTSAIVRPLASHSPTAALTRLFVLPATAEM